MKNVREYLHDNDQVIESINYKTNTAIAELKLDFYEKLIAGSFKLSTLPYALGKLQAKERYDDEYDSFNKLHERMTQMVQRELDGSVSVERLQ
ncbi:hypothetical protein [Paenibacillus flagellatus]|nr:hypothetical protein [Paenibacillus flagellatus]